MGWEHLRWSKQRRRLYRFRLACVDFARVLRLLKQMGCRTVSGVRHKTRHAGGAGVDMNDVGLRENCIARENVKRSGASAAAENKEPSLPICFQPPPGVWR